ncbi:MAG: hypothetical protein ACTSVV_08620 [Promethearchaeota archaeon]
MLKVVKTEGKPYDLGLNYGEQCKKEVRLSISTFYLYKAMSLTPGFKEGHPKLVKMLPRFFVYKGAWVNYAQL